MEGVDSRTKRSNYGAAALVHGVQDELGSAVRAHARRAREFGSGSLKFSDKVRLAYWNAFQHDCLNTAKATAYSAIFAVFPVLGVAAALVAMLPYTAPLRYQLALFFGRVLPAAVSPLLTHYFITARSSPQSARVLLGALLVSILGAAGVLGTLMEGFRRAYNLVDDCWGKGLRGQVRRQVQSFLLVPIALVPLTAASVLVVFGHYLLASAVHLTPSGWDRGFFVAANIVRWTVSLGTTAAVLAFIYRYAVPVRPAWRRVWPGAAFATVTWFVSTLLFGLYVTYYANYSRVYGSLGTGIVLLVWLFITALSVLCGAELNAELGRAPAAAVLPDRNAVAIVACDPTAGTTQQPELFRGDRHEATATAGGVTEPAAASESTAPAGEQAR